MRLQRLRLLLAGIIASALSFSAPACSTQIEGEISPSDADEVRATFEAYRNAVVADDGAVAADWVSQGTLRHAEALRDLALDATRAELEAEPIGSEMHVLMFRLFNTSEELEAADARGAFALGVEKGIVSNLWLEDDQMRDLRVEEGGAALVASRVQGYQGMYEVGAILRFVRERGSWKLDLMPEFERLSELMEANAVETGIGLRDLARSRIEIYTSKMLAPRHLEPMRSLRAGAELERSEPEGDPS